MKTKQINTKLEPFNIIYEQCLQNGAFFVGLYHLLMSIYQYYSEFNNSVFQLIDYALFVLLVCSTILYLLICKYKCPFRFKQIKTSIYQFLRPESVLLVILFIWYFISCLAVGDHYSGNWLLGNTFALLDTAMSFFIFFPMAFYLKNSNHMRTYMHASIHLLVCIMTILMTIVLWNVFHLNILHIPGGQIGMSADVRLCINCHPNTAAAYAALILMLCLYMLITQPFCVKILYGYSIIVHLFILMLTNSRTCFVAISFCYAVAIGLLLWHRTIHRTLIQRCLISIISALVVILAFSAIRDGVFRLFESITHFSELLAAQYGSGNDVSIRALDLGSGEMHSRYKLWTYALKSMVSDWHKAVFGVTPISVISALSLASNGMYSEWYTHNQFLEVGVALGWPGLFVFVSFMLLIARNCLKVGLSKEQRPFPGFYVIPITILMLVISNLTEAILLFYHFLSGNIFFILCGWVTLESTLLPELPFVNFKKKNTHSKRKHSK